jgi:hypothetical protein
LDYIFDLEDAGNTSFRKYQWISAGINDGTSLSGAGIAQSE